MKLLAIKSNYKPKKVRVKRVRKEGKYVRGTPFEQHFGFGDHDRPIEEYLGGGLESVSLPKIKQQLTDY